MWRLDMTITFNANAVYSIADFMVIECNSEAMVVIKPTILAGCATSAQDKMGARTIIFSPDFLRELKAMYDNSYPIKSVSNSWGMRTGKIMEKELFIA